MTSSAAAILERARWFSANISAEPPPKITKQVSSFSARPDGSNEPGLRRIRRVSAEIFAFFALGGLYLGPPGAHEAVGGLFGKASSGSKHDKNLASIGPAAAELRAFKAVCSGVTVHQTACAQRWPSRPTRVLHTRLGAPSAAVPVGLLVQRVSCQVPFGFWEERCQNLSPKRCSRP